MRIKLVVASFMLLKSLTVYAVPEKIGNGGGALVCRNQTKEILSSQTLDLYEVLHATKQNKDEQSLNLNDKFTAGSATVDYIIQTVKQKIFKLDPVLYLDLMPFVVKINRLKNNPPSITHVSDTLEVISDFGNTENSMQTEKSDSIKCMNGELKYEQVVNYKHDGRILVQKELFDYLSPIDRAAIIFHEIVYTYRRGLGDTDSEKSRLIVGLLFSDASDIVILDKLKSIEKEASHGLFKQKINLGSPLDETRQLQSPKYCISTVGIPFNIAEQEFQKSTAIGLNGFQFDRTGYFLSKTSPMRVLTKVNGSDLEYSVMQEIDEEVQFPCQLRETKNSLTPENSYKLFEINQQGLSQTSRIIVNQSIEEIRENISANLFHSKNNDWTVFKNSIQSQLYTSTCIASQPKYGCRIWTYRMSVDRKFLIERENIFENEDTLKTVYRYYDLARINGFIW